MTITQKIIYLLILSAGFIGISVLPSEADSPSIKSTLNYQIIIDTGGGGGEGATLPDVKWTINQTPNGKPFIFWSWDPTS